MNLDGTIIRIDPASGAALPDNPLSGSGDANARRIVTQGLRNPLRFAFRPGTSELWVGDVGWATWEEINRIDNPLDGSVKNFGWPCYEGDGTQPAYDGNDLPLCEALYGSGSVTGPVLHLQPCRRSGSGRSLQQPGQFIGDGGCVLSRQRRVVSRRVSRGAVLRRLLP